MEHNIFDRGLAGEPALRTDPEDVARRGAAIVRRRRSAAVAAVAATAVAITLGAALIPKMTGDDSAAPAQIPGCAVVLGPTSGAVTSSGSSAVGTSSSSSAMSAPLTAVWSTSASSSPSAMVTTTDAATSPVATGSPAVPTETASASTVLGPTALSDLTRAPDELTGLLWDRFRSWGVSVHATSMLGDLSFSGTGEDAIYADGWAQSPDGEGEIALHIARDDQGGAPACHVGELDRRVTYPDGTVVDLNYGTNQAASNLDPVGVPVMSFHAVAYKPDGTLVIAFANNAVQLGDDDPDGDVAGIRTAAAPPLTLEQVQDLVTDPTFSISNPTYLQAQPQVRAMVPDVVGLPEHDARNVLSEAGFTVSSGTPAAGQSATAGVGVVTAQSPAGGERWRRSTPIALTTTP